MRGMVDKWGAVQGEAVAGRGFTQIPNDLLQLNSFINEGQRLTPVELLVVFQLVGAWWQRDKMPFPSMAELAKRLGVSERQVQRAIARLVKANIIAKTKRRRRGMIAPNAYDLTPLVELLGSIAKEYPNAHARTIKRGRLEPSPTS
jgi:predicted transcriptional regulator